MIDFILLGFLMYKPMTGYDIKGFMSISTVYFYDASFGSIYPALKRLVENGLVSVREDTENGKLRKVYAVEEPGRKEFYQWLENPLVLSKGGPGHLIQIFFYEFLPKEKTIVLLHDFIERLEKTILELESIEPVIQSHADIFQLSTQRFGKAYYRFVADWYKVFLKEIENR